MITEEQRQEDESAFADAFNNDPEMAPQQTEDQAFGLEDPPAEGEPAQDAAPAVEPTSAEEETHAEAAGDTAAPVSADTRDGGEVAAPAAKEAPEAPDADDAPAAAQAAPDDKERQRLKSWEGRLRKMQSDLEAKGAVVDPEPGDVSAAGVDAADDGAVMSEAASRAADAVESGEMTPEQAMRQLSEDFGDDFVRMIEIVAGAKASKAGADAVGERVGKLDQAVGEIVADITDSKARRHFEQIAAEHPDFRDVGKSEGFADFINGQPNAEDAKRVVNSGSAAEINKLLSAYKKSQVQETPAEIEAGEQPSAKPVVDEATSRKLDDAEGVRSSGMKLPDQPKLSSASYEDAWKEFE